MIVDIELIEDWIEALESGDFEQEREQLHGGNRHFCCLGVGALVEGFSPRDMVYMEVASDLNGSVLGDMLRELVANPPNNNSEGQLAILNDEWGLTFDQIAYILRRELLAPLKKALREAA